MRNSIPSIIFKLALLLSLSLLWGCGTISTSTSDSILYPKDGTNIILRISDQGTAKEIPLEVGDKLELENTTDAPAPNFPYPVLSDTCLMILDYLGIGTDVVIYTGYDSAATNPPPPPEPTAGTPKKYPDWVKTIGEGTSKYEVRIIRPGGTETIQVAYSKGMLLKNISGFSDASDPNTVYTASQLFNLLHVPYGTDRTICFKDPYFIKAEIGALPANPQAANNPPTPPAGGDPIPVPQNSNVSTGGGTTLPGGPSTGTGTTAAAPSEQKSGGGGGCPLQLDPASHTTSTAWVWLTALCVTGVLMGRRKWLSKIYR